MSPNTKRSPNAVPARLARSVGSPVHKPVDKSAGRVGQPKRASRLPPSPYRPSAGSIGNAAIGRKLDKALRKIDIARRERGADFALRDLAIEDAVERLVADLDRVVRPRQAASGAAMPPRTTDERGERKNEAPAKREGRMTARRR